MESKLYNTKKENLHVHIFSPTEQKVLIQNFKEMGMDPKTGEKIKSEQINLVYKLFLCPLEIVKILILTIIYLHNICVYIFICIICFTYLYIIHICMYMPICMCMCTGVKICIYLALCIIFMGFIAMQ